MIQQTRPDLPSCSRAVLCSHEENLYTIVETRSESLPTIRTAYPAGVFARTTPLSTVDKRPREFTSSDVFIIKSASVGYYAVPHLSNQNNAKLDSLISSLTNTEYSYTFYGCTASRLDRKRVRRTQISMVVESHQNNTMARARAAFVLFLPSGIRTAQFSISCEFTVSNWAGVQAARRAGGEGCGNSALCN